MRERVIGAIGAAAIVALLGYAMLAGLRVAIGARQDRTISLLALAAPPAPPRERRAAIPRKKSTAHAPAPSAPAGKAAEIAAPDPVAARPAPPRIVAPIAGNGALPSNGAGGSGTGEGEGGIGLQDGGGAGGGDDTPPRQTGGRLKYSDLSPDLRAAGIGGTVAVRYTVGIDGQVSECRVTGSSGNADLDRQTCALIERRFRFRPSRDDRRRPVAAEIEERHDWIGTPPDKAVASRRPPTSAMPEGADGDQQPLR